MGLEYALPVLIEDDVWIGGDVVITPGVTIGKGSIISSGSIVTMNISKSVLMFGNPCGIHRSTTDRDK